MDVKYKIVPKFIFRDVEDEGIILLPETDTLYALSESAKLIWKEMIADNNCITYSHMLHILSKYYEGEATEIKRDVDAFVSKMIKFELFKVVEF